MTSVTRLAGALLVEDERAVLLVGELKRPCDWSAAGLGDPGPIDARARPWTALQRVGPRRPTTPELLLELGAAACAELLASRLLIARNASVSERLWSLLVGESGAERIDWLAQVPEPVWDCVRDSVLRCS
jgi:hypothetical protein